MARVQHTDKDGNTTVDYTGDLAEAAAECTANIDTQFANALAEPVIYPAANAALWIDDATRVNINAMVTDALVAKGDNSWDAAFTWPMADGSAFDVATPDDMIALGKFAKGAYQALVARRDTAKKAIEQAQTQDQAYAVIF